MISCFQSQALEPFPDLTQPQSAFVQFPHGGQGEALSVDMGNVYMRIADIEELIDAVRHTVVSTVEEAMRQDNKPVETVVLNLPCTFFMLRTLR